MVFQSVPNHQLQSVAGTGHTALPLPSCDFGIQDYPEIIISQSREPMNHRAIAMSTSAVFVFERGFEKERGAENGLYQSCFCERFFPVATVKADPCAKRFFRAVLTSADCFVDVPSTHIAQVSSQSFGEDCVIKTVFMSSNFSLEFSGRVTFRSCW